MRVQHNRIQHRVFLWVYMNIHITQHKCLRSFASHRRSPQTRDPVEVHWLTLYTWYVESTQEFHTQVQYMCNSEVSISKSCLYWPSVLYPAPCHPPFAPSFGGAQRLGTTQESTSCNTTVRSRLSPSVRPLAFTDFVRGGSTRTQRIFEWRMSYSRDGFSNILDLMNWTVRTLNIKIENTQLQLFSTQKKESIVAICNQKVKPVFPCSHYFLAHTRCSSWSRSARTSGDEDVAQYCVVTIDYAGWTHTDRHQVPRSILS